MDIPLYRQQYVALVLSSFVQSYDIQAPVDCISLIKRLPHITLLETDAFQKHVEAVSVALPDCTSAFIIVNRHFVHYPYTCSKHRRLNFTLAHELGHILLQHLALSSEQKTPHMCTVEDAEASLFASSLLMPLSLLQTLNFRSLEKVAQALHVSQAALSMRLSQLNFSLRGRRKKVCAHCHFSEFTPTTHFCPICGHSIQNNDNGVLMHPYVGIAQNKFRKAIDCPKCAMPYAHGTTCTICQTPAFNACVVCQHANLGVAHYCEICGNATVYAQLLSTLFNA
ncbi:MAG: ImmA/IrrE family metallo-endopeptidase [Hyphomonadaceae bacterium]|nr:ImmA/IrrE family metallo-endopeptidase [Clostridia bacterium]